jgi:hypothetical protein
MAQNIPFCLFYSLLFQIVALWVLTGGDKHLKEAAACIFTNERLCPREIYIIRVNQPT